MTIHPIQENIYYIYIVRCQDDSFYTGITNNLSKRMRAHCGKIAGGARYTHSHPIQSLEVVWETNSKTAAARMEYAIKKLPRAKKLELLQHPERICSHYVPHLQAYPYIVRNGITLDACLK